MNRNATLATTSIILDEHSKRPGVNIERALAAFDEAASWKPDLVVFPEEIDYAGVAPEEAKKAGEPVPGGPIQEAFAARARKHNANVVLGIRERDGDELYNVGVVIDRLGQFVGKYRKTHLAPGEAAEVRPGDSYPVFQLDFGVVGVMICMDVHYPEPWRILALQGADVIVHPTMWRDYTGDLCESVVNARAIDNQVYVVTSHYITMPFLTGGAMGHARIVDPYGRTRASTSHSPGIAVAQVDLDQAYEYWVTGDLKREFPTLKDCFLGMRRPETYDILTRPDDENSWKIDDPTLYASEE
ncbi:MAG: carbon-nitrogen hydrolase family protein [Armatimonadota bacterium]|nr:carbon-nitrogen hydrolase family protein [Armatimonadota bacterium]